MQVGNKFSTRAQKERKVETLTNFSVGEKLNAGTITGLSGFGIHLGAAKIEFALFNVAFSLFNGANGKDYYRANCIGGCNLPAFIPAAKFSNFEIGTGLKGKDIVREDCVYVRFVKTKAGEQKAGGFLIHNIALPLWLRANLKVMTAELKAEIDFFELDGVRIDAKSINDDKEGSALKACGGYTITACEFLEIPQAMWDEYKAEAAKAEAENNKPEEVNS
jgi:hypothetical protein